MTDPATVRDARDARITELERDLADLKLGMLAAARLTRRAESSRDDWHRLYETTHERLIEALGQRDEWKLAYAKALDGARELKEERDQLAALLEPLAVCQLGGSMEGDPNCCAGCRARAELDRQEQPDFSTIPDAAKDGEA